MDIAAEQLSVAENTPTYTVEGLLQRAGFISQNKAATKVDGLVRVKGVVSKIKRYPRVAYLTLSDREQIISVKVDAEQAAIENQAIIVEGTLLLRPSAFFSGLEAYIDGHIVGSWIPAKSSGLISSVPLEKRSYLRFDDFLDKHPLDSLLLLGTKTAITDVLSNLGNELANLVTNKTIRVGKKESLLEDLAFDMPANVRAIAIVRGGDDNTIRVWDDHEVISLLLALELPFYIALGHSHAMTLADRYADGSFHTPSALGVAIKSSVERVQRIDLVVDECKRLEHENAQLSMLQSTSQSVQRPTTNSLRSAIYGALFTIGIYLLLKYL